MKKIILGVFISILVSQILLAESKITANETVLYAFQGTTDGADPTTGLVADANGNLYGSTFTGVYELSPPQQQGGNWTFNIIAPKIASAGNLIFDAAGNLYGLSITGGTGTNCQTGCGTVFELSPPAQPGGLWTETILYDFQGGATDGAFPVGSLIFDKFGGLYGVTQYGGFATADCANPMPGCGTVFQLTPPSVQGQPWTESILYFFRGGSDGHSPRAGPTFDSTESNLYGTTTFGGNSSSCVKTIGCGTIFMLKRPADQGQPWREQVVFRFTDTGSGGRFPEGKLLILGNAIYGTLTQSGSSSGSNVFQLALINGVLTETVLVMFQDLCEVANSGVVADRFGNLYGATSSAGCEGENDGEVFELEPPSTKGGPWTILWAPGLAGGAEGNDPNGGVILVGNAIYGVATFGGDLNCGDDGMGCGVVYSYSY